MESHLRIECILWNTNQCCYVSITLRCPFSFYSLRAPTTLQVRTGNHPLGLDLASNIVSSTVTVNLLAWTRPLTIILCFPVSALCLMMSGGNRDLTLLCCSGVLCPVVMAPDSVLFSAFLHLCVHYFPSRFYTHAYSSMVCQPQCQRQTLARVVISLPPAAF